MTTQQNQRTIAQKIKCRNEMSEAETEDYLEELSEQFSFHHADRLLVAQLFRKLQVGDRASIFCAETVGSLKCLRQGSPGAINAFMDQLFEQFGDEAEFEWEKAQRKQRMEGLELSLEAATGLGGKASAILEAEAIPFKDRTGESYVIVFDNDVRKVLDVESRAFNDWLTARLWQICAKGLSKNALDETKAAAHALATVSGKVRDVHLRVASVGEKHYIDLCDQKWRVVEISEEGWKVVSAPPVFFTRNKNMLPLPVPKLDGDIDELSDLINIEEGGDFQTVVAWMIMAQRTTGNYPMLSIIGSSGSAKSTTHRTIRRLVDPNVGDLRVAPKNATDILVAAKNNHVVSYENLSRLGNDVQDYLCSISTGGAYSARALYSNADETVEQFKRPILVNGISDFITRPDLMQRALVIRPPKIEIYQTDEDIEAHFSNKYAEVFGALLDIHVGAIKFLPDIKSSLDACDLPRMSAFALLGEAVSQAMGGRSNQWLKHYKSMVAEQTSSVLENSLVADPLERFAINIDEWEGTMLELMDELESYREPDSDWYKSPRGLSDGIQRIVGELEKRGVIVEKLKRRKRGNLYRVAYVGHPKTKKKTDWASGNVNLSTRPKRRGTTRRTPTTRPAPTMH